MKGIIFTALNQMIEEKYGIVFWEAILDEVKPKSEGAYTAGMNYPDSELMDLIKIISDLKQISVSEFVEEFGVYMFPILAKNYSFFMKKDTTLKDFLKSIDQIIHVEVKKLNPDANLPSISYEENSDNELVMIYRSPRKLCHLAIGLIQGASNHFNKKISIKQPICVLEGGDHCRLEITFEQ